MLSNCLIDDIHAKGYTMKKERTSCWEEGSRLDAVDRTPAVQSIVCNGFDTFPGVWKWIMFCFRQVVDYEERLLQGTDLHNPLCFQRKVP